MIQKTPISRMCRWFRYEESARAGSAIAQIFGLSRNVTWHREIDGNGGILEVSFKRGLDKTLSTPPLDGKCFSYSSAPARRICRRRAWRGGNGSRSIRLRPSEPNPQRSVYSIFKKSAFHCTYRSQKQYYQLWMSIFLIKSTSSESGREYGS